MAAPDPAGAKATARVLGHLYPSLLYTWAFLALPRKTGHWDHIVMLFAQASVSMCPGHIDTPRLCQFRGPGRERVGGKPSGLRRVTVYSGDARGGLGSPRVGCTHRGAQSLQGTAQTPQQSAARLQRSAVSGCGKPTHPADLRPCRRLAEKQESAFWDGPAPLPGRPQWLARCPKAELLMNQAGERWWEASALTNEGRGRGGAEGRSGTEQPNLPHCPSWGQQSSGRARSLRVPQEPQPCVLSPGQGGREGQHHSSPSTCPSARGHLCAWLRLLPRPGQRA